VVDEEQTTQGRATIIDAEVARILNEG